MNTLLKLVSHEDNNISCSLAKVFDIALEEEEGLQRWDTLQVYWWNAFQ